MVTNEEKKMLTMGEVSKEARDWAIRHCAVKNAEDYLNRSRERKARRMQRKIAMAWLIVSVVACVGVGIWMYMQQR